MNPILSTLLGCIRSECTIISLFCCSAGGEGKRFALEKMTTIARSVGCYQLYDGAAAALSCLLLLRCPAALIITTLISDAANGGKKGYFWLSKADCATSESGWAGES